MATVRYRPPVRVSLRTAPGQAAMRRLGQVIARNLVARTQGGQDERGRAFRPYTAAYARAKGVSPADVDLTRSGAMLDGFGVQAVSPRSVTLGWQDPALADRARFNERRGRRFLGVPPQAVADARAVVARALKARR
jgi:hypothetical protein